MEVAALNAARWLPGILRLTENLDVEGDLARDALDRQRAVDAQPIGARLCDARRLERDLRIPLDIEEVGGAQVRVAIRHARVDARGINDDVKGSVSEIAGGRQAYRYER